MLYLLATYLGGTPKITMSIIYGIAATASFLGNRKLTFEHKGAFWGTGIRFIIAHCFGYGINLVILIVLADKLGYAHQWAQVMPFLLWLPFFPDI